MSLFKVGDEVFYSGSVPRPVSKCGQRIGNDAQRKLGRSLLEVAEDLRRTGTVGHTPGVQLSRQPDAVAIALGELSLLQRRWLVVGIPPEINLLRTRS